MAEALEVERGLDNPDPLRSADWVAARLGISVWAVYELTKRGRLPCVRLGRLVRFDADTIEAFIRGGGTAARAAVPAVALATSRRKGE